MVSMDGAANCTLYSILRTYVLQVFCGSRCSTVAETLKLARLPSKDNAYKSQVLHLPDWSELTVLLHVPCVAHLRAMNRSHKSLLISVRSARVLQSASPLVPFFAIHPRTHHACTFAKRLFSSVAMDGHGDLNNVHSARATSELPTDPRYRYRSLAIEDGVDTVERHLYRPFLLSEPFAANDWVEQLDLSTVLKLVESEILDKKQDRLRILVLYGSLRSR